MRVVVGFGSLAGDCLDARLGFTGTLLHLLLDRRGGVRDCDVNSAAITVGAHMFAA